MQSRGSKPNLLHLGFTKGARFPRVYPSASLPSHHLHHRQTLSHGNPVCTLQGLGAAEQQHAVRLGDRRVVALAREAGEPGRNLRRPAQRRGMLIVRAGLSSVTWLLPDRFSDSELVLEGIHTAVNLLSTFHDSIINEGPGIAEAGGVDLVFLLGALQQVRRNRCPRSEAVPVAQRLESRAPPPAAALAARTVACRMQQRVAIWPLPGQAAAPPRHNPPGGPSATGASAGGAGRHSTGAAGPRQQI